MSGPRSQPSSSCLEWRINELENGEREERGSEPAEAPPGDSVGESMRLKDAPSPSTKLRQAWNSVRFHVVLLALMKVTLLAAK